MVLIILFIFVHLRVTQESVVVSTQRNISVVHYHVSHERLVNICICMRCDDINTKAKDMINLISSGLAAYRDYMQPWTKVPGIDLSGYRRTLSEQGNGTLVIYFVPLII